MSFNYSYESLMLVFEVVTWPDFHSNTLQITLTLNEMCQLLTLSYLHAGHEIQGQIQGELRSSLKEKCLKNTVGSEWIAFRQCEYFKGPSLLGERLDCSTMGDGSSLPHTCRETRLKLGNKNMIQWQVLWCRAAIQPAAVFTVCGHGTMSLIHVFSLRATGVSQVWHTCNIPPIAPVTQLQIVSSKPCRLTHSL